MSPAPSRLLIAFEGEVECRPCGGAVSLTLSGREQTAAHPTGQRPTAQLLLAGAHLAGTLPARLHDVRVSVVIEPAIEQQRLLLLRARGLQQTVSCRSAQLHRDVAAAFFAAVPPARVPLRARLGWTLLLQLLRLPGAARLLTRLRGHR